MGDRANYAIREGGKVELFYSHWGAITIAEDIFWGPARTEQFIRQNKPGAEWLDDVWAQGGIALDKDNRRLTYYYLEWPDEEDVRGVYETLLAEIWAADGWSVHCAADWGDVAEAVGVDRALVASPPMPPNKIELQRLGENLRRRPSCCGIVSVKVGDGWQDRLIDFWLCGVLMNGPALVRYMDELADLDELPAYFEKRPADDSAKTPGDWIDEFCAIDPERRTVTVRLPQYEMDNFQFLQDAWPDWSLTCGPGGVQEHFGYTGRDIPLDLIPSPKPPEPEPRDRSFEGCVKLIREHLAGSDARKAESHAFHQRFAKRIREESDGPVTFAPGFFSRVPSIGPTLLDRVRFGLRKLSKRLRG